MARSHIVRFFCNSQEQTWAVKDFWCGLSGEADILLSEFAAEPRRRCDKIGIQLAVEIGRLALKLPDLMARADRNHATCRLDRRRAML